MGDHVTTSLMLVHFLAVLLLAEPQAPNPTLTTLLQTIDNWRQQILDEQSRDATVTSDQLFDLEQHTDGLKLNLMSITESLVSNQMVSDVMNQLLVEQPIQQQDAITTEEATKQVFRSVTHRCIDAIDPSQIQPILSQSDLYGEITDFTKILFSEIRKQVLKQNVTEPVIEELPESNHIQVSRHFSTLLGLVAAPTVNATRHHNITTYSCSSNPSEWSTAQTAWCCVHRNIGCEQSDPLSPLMSSILSELQALHAALEAEMSESQQEIEQEKGACMNRGQQLVASIEELDGMITVASDRLNSTIEKERLLTKAVHQNQNDIASIRAALTSFSNQMDAISAAANQRHVARSEEIASIDTIRSLLLSLETPSGIASIASGNNTSTSSSGRSPETATRTCLELKRSQPSIEDGVYWIDLGEGAMNAFQVFCDMTTDGGGFTVFFKNVSGLVGQPLAFSGSEGNQTERSDVVFPLWFTKQLHGQINEKVYEFFGSRPRQQWLKSMQLLRKSSRNQLVPLITQSILVKLGQNTLSDVIGQGHEPQQQQQCHSLESPVRIFSSRPQSTITANSTTGNGMEDHPITGHVDNPLGFSSLVTSASMGASGIGFGAVSPNTVDQCGHPLDEGQVCDTLICENAALQVFDMATSQPTTKGSGILISSVFNTDCAFNCPHELPAPYGEVFVFAARAEPCPTNDFGLECSGNGVCEDGTCKCAYGYNGPNCAEITCVHSCSHGNCVFGQCVCDEGFYGSSCSDQVQCDAPPELIPHYVPPSWALERRGTVKCSGHAFGDSCVMTCDEGYLTKQVSSVTVRIWNDQCDGHASSVVNVPVNTCSRISDSEMVMLSPPDNNSTVFVKFYRGIRCDGEAVMSRGVTCGRTCEKIGDRFVGISCRGSQSQIRVCHAQGNSTQGVWDNSPPQCIPNGCFSPSLPDHSHSTCSGTQLGDTCHVTCNQGFVLHNHMRPVVDGEVVLECHEMGWASKLYEMTQITCEKRACSTPQTIIQGSYECSDLQYGSRCALSCNDSYAPSPDASLEIVCGEDGKWIGWNEDACVLDS